MAIKVTRTRKRRYPVYKKLSFEEALEKLTGQSSVVEGQMDPSKPRGVVPGTRDKGAIPDPSFMLDSEDRFLGGQEDPPRLPPRSGWLELQELGHLKGMEVVRSKAQTDIMESMSLKDIFGELINKYQVLPNDMMSDVINLYGGGFESPVGQRVSEYLTPGGEAPNEDNLKVFFARKLATERITLDLRGSGIFGM